MRWAWPPWSEEQARETERSPQQHGRVSYLFNTDSSVFTGQKSDRVRDTNRASFFSLASFTGPEAFRSIRISRYLSIKNSHIRKYRQLLKSNVLGASGLGARFSDEGVRDMWKEWTKRADLTGRSSWPEFQELVLWTVIRDGEAVVEFIRVNGELHLYLRNTLHQARTLTETKAQTVSVIGGGGRVAQGVRLDDYDRAMGYLFHRSEGGFFEIPAERVSHVFVREFEEQLHGIPWLVSTEDGLLDLTEFEEAAIINAKINASQSALVQVSDKAMVEEADASAAVAKVVTMEPGERVVVPEGVSINGMPAEFPAQAYEAYRRGMLSSAAVGLGVSYATLTSDLKGANFSSLRQGRLDDVAFYEQVQRMMCEWLDRVYEAWVFHYGLSGSRRREERIRRASCEWVVPGHGYIDPVKETTAQTGNLKNLTESHSEAIARSGREPKQVYGLIAQDIKDMQEAGIPDDIIRALYGAASLGSTEGTPGPPPPGQEPEDEEDDEEREDEDDDEREERKEREEEEGDDD